MFLKPVNECPICKSRSLVQIGNDKVGYGLVRLDLDTKTVEDDSKKEYLPFNVYICQDCGHVELKNVPLNK